MVEARIITVYFEPGPHARDPYKCGRFIRLLRAYQRSAEALGVDLECVEIPTPPEDGKTRWMIENTVKLEKWRDLVHEADGPLILTDADMLMTGDPRHAFDVPFDVAITERTGSGIPFNGGVFFARPTDVARGFMDRWCDVNGRMMREKQFHSKWRKRYKGINQAALGYMLEEGDTAGANIARLPCAIYNAVDNDWPKINTDQTKLVHVKGQLRSLCVDPDYDGSGLADSTHRIAETWRTFDHTPETSSCPS